MGAELQKSKRKPNIEQSSSTKAIVTAMTKTIIQSKNKCDFLCQNVKQLEVYVPTQ